QAYASLQGLFPIQSFIQIKSWAVFSDSDLIDSSLPSEIPFPFLIHLPFAVPAPLCMRVVFADGTASLSFPFKFQ
ncbi:hypothetical protein WAI85_20625, partial [Acinetobacter baumannii]